MGTCQSNDLNGEGGRVTVPHHIRRNDISNRSILSDQIVSDFASNSASGSLGGNGSNDSFSTIESGDRILLPIHQTKVILIVQDLKECNGDEKKTKKNREERQGDEDNLEDNECIEKDEDNSSNGSCNSEKENGYGCGYLKHQEHALFHNNEDRRVQTLEDWGSTATPKVSNANNVNTASTKPNDSKKVETSAIHNDNRSYDDDATLTSPALLLGSMPPSDINADDEYDRCDEELNYCADTIVIDSALEIDTDMKPVDFEPPICDTTKKKIMKHDLEDIVDIDHNDGIKTSKKKKHYYHQSTTLETPETQPETPDNEYADAYSPQSSVFIYPACEEESPIPNSECNLDLQQNQRLPDKCTLMTTLHDDSDNNTDDCGKINPISEVKMGSFASSSQFEQDTVEKHPPRQKPQNIEHTINKEALTMNGTTALPLKTPAGGSTNSITTNRTFTNRQLIDSLKNAADTPQKVQNETQQLNSNFAYTNDDSANQTKAGFLNSLRQVADSPDSSNSEVTRELPDFCPHACHTPNSLPNRQQSKSDYLNSLRSFADSPHPQHNCPGTPMASATSMTSNLVITKPLLVEGADSNHDNVQAAPSQTEDDISEKMPSTTTTSDSVVKDMPIKMTSATNYFLVNVGNDQSDILKRKKQELQNMRCASQVNKKKDENTESTNLPPPSSSILKLGKGSLRAIEESTIASLPDDSYHHDLRKGYDGEEEETMTTKSTIQQQNRQIGPMLSSDHDDQSSISSLGSNSFIGGFFAANLAANTTATEGAIPFCESNAIQDFNCIMSNAVPDYHFISEEVENECVKFDPVIFPNDCLFKFDVGNNPAIERNRSRLSPSKPYTSLSYQTPKKGCIGNTKISAPSPPPPIQKLNPHKLDISQRRRDGSGVVITTNKRRGRILMARKQEATARLTMEQKRKELQSVDPGLVVEFDDLKAIVTKSEKELKIKGVVERRVDQFRDIVTNQKLFQDFQDIEKNREVEADGNFGNVETGNKPVFDLKTVDDWFVNFHQPVISESSDDPMERDREACFSLLGANNNSFEQVMESKKKQYLSLQPTCKSLSKTLDVSLEIGGTAEGTSNATMTNETKKRRKKRMKNKLKKIGSSMRRKLGSTRKKDKKANLGIGTTRPIHDKLNKEGSEKKSKEASQDEQRSSSFRKTWENKSFKKHNIGSNHESDPNTSFDDNISYFDSQHSTSCNGSKNYEYEGSECSYVNSTSGGCAADDTSLQESEASDVSCISSLKYLTLP